MNCEEASPLLDAYFDSELDLAASVRVEEHVASCGDCASTLASLQRLRDELTPAVFQLATSEDVAKLDRKLRREIVPAQRWRLFQPAAWAAVAAALVVAVLLPWRNADGGAAFTRELVDNHIRSLTASHLVDVPSSDQHTVKPWFQGKLDFAPDVTDFADKGFELVGGRLDVLNGKPAAAIVYRRRGHYINVWTIRGEDHDDPVRLFSTDGYQLAHWRSRGLDHWVVSDINSGELETLLRYLRGR